MCSHAIIMTEVTGFASASSQSTCTAEQDSFVDPQALYTINLRTFAVSDQSKRVPLLHQPLHAL